MCIGDALDEFEDFAAIFGAEVPGAFLVPIDPDISYYPKITSRITRYHQNHLMFYCALQHLRGRKNCQRDHLRQVCKSGAFLSRWGVLKEFGTFHETRP
jgi:hypothetical protein